MEFNKGSIVQNCWVESWRLNCYYSSQVWIQTIWCVGILFTPHVFSRIFFKQQCIILLHVRIHTQSGKVRYSSAINLRDKFSHSCLEFFTRIIFCYVQILNNFLSEILGSWDLILIVQAQLCKIRSFSKTFDWWYLTCKTF